MTQQGREQSACDLSKGSQKNGIKIKIYSSELEFLSGCHEH